MSEVEPRYRLVLELARTVTARRDLEDVLSETFTGLRQILPFAGGSIQLLDDEGWIRMAATEPAAPADVLALRIPLGSTVGGRVILTERPVYIADVLADPAVPAERRKAHLSPGGIRSYLGVPLLADGRAIGLIQIDSPETDAWSEEDRLLLMSIGPIVGAAIQNAKAYAMHAEAAAHAGELERRQANVDATVSAVIDSNLSELRELIASASNDDAIDMRVRITAALFQIDQLRSALTELLSPEAAAEARAKAITLAAAARPRPPAPRTPEADTPRAVIDRPATISTGS